MNLVKNFLLTSISIILTILFIEINMEIFFPQEKNSSWRTQDQKTGSYFNIKNGIAQHEYFGVSEKISVKYRFGEFHNREVVKDDKLKYKNKILILGDSHIFGWLLKDSETFTYSLQKKFNKYKFINASAGGWSDIDSFNYLKKFCKNIKPNKIFFFLEIDRTIGSNLLSVDKNDKIKIKNLEINKVKKKFNQIYLLDYISRHSNLFQLLKRAYLNRNIRNSINYIDDTRSLSIDEKVTIGIWDDHDLLIKFIESINDEAKNCNSEITFIDRGWYSKNSTSKIKNLVFESLIKKNQKKLINFISLYDDMNEVRDNKNKYLLEEGHPNRLGNDVTFKALIKNLNIY